MNKEEVAALLSRGKRYALQGKYERFKVNSTFDYTAKNVTLLGQDFTHVQKLAPITE